MSKEAVEALEAARAEVARMVNDAVNDCAAMPVELSSLEYEIADKIIATIRAALQQQAEPVAWMDETLVNGSWVASDLRWGKDGPVPHSERCRPVPLVRGPVLPTPPEPGA